MYSKFITPFLFTERPQTKVSLKYASVHISLLHEGTMVCCFTVISIRGKTQRAQNFYKILECNRECNKHIQSVTKSLTKRAQLFLFSFTANIVCSFFTDQTHNIFFSWEDFGKVSRAVIKFLLLFVFPESTGQLLLLDYPSRRSVSISESEEQSSGLLRFSFLLIVANVFFCSFYCKREGLQFGLMLISLSYLSTSLSSVLLGESTNWLSNGKGVTWSS